MMLLALSIIASVFAAIQAGLFVRNLPLFLAAMDSVLPSNETSNAISVLIPARDEESGIRDSLNSVLRSERVELEVIVLDDHSTDSTPALVEKVATEDSRVRLIHSDPLPESWNGKQHACAQLAKAARHQLLVFLDADVRLQPNSLAQLLYYYDRSRVDLLSAFPRQVTGTLMEKILIPMMHYILLCFLPIARMRKSVHPAYAAGCGQLFVTNQSAYKQAGTHAAIRSSRHDGLKLPKAYRAAGLTTDVIDGSDLAECRMYTSASQVIRGLLKNADEGIANVKLIVPFSVMLMAASVLPFVLLACLSDLDPTPLTTVATILSVAAILLSHLPRAIAAITFRQSWIGVVLHSVGVVVFVLLQWIALGNRLAGRQVAWRGRVESQRPSTT